MRESFEKHIKGLNAEVVAMGEMVATATSRSVEALASHDIEKAKKIVNDDLLINKKRWQIEEKCINLIALQQPVATDLRDIIAVLNIVTELERMGDYAEGIANYARRRAACQAADFLAQDGRKGKQYAQKEYAGPCQQGRQNGERDMQ